MKRQLYLEKNSNFSNNKDISPRGGKTPSPKGNNKNKKKRRFNFFDFIALILIIAIGLLGAISIKDYLQYKVLQFDVPVKGLIEDTANANVIVVRHEYLLKAPFAGNFQPVVEGGQRVVYGATIGYMVNDSGQRQAIKAPKAGIVLFEADGNEERLKIDYIEKMDLDLLFESMAEDNKAIGIRTNYGKDQPVGKIVDNLLDITVILRLDKSIEVAQEGSLSFYPGKSTASLTGTITQALESEQYRFLLLNVCSREDILVHKRSFEAEILLGKLMGSIIPREALTSDEDGKEGVFCRSGRKVVFRPVEVIGFANQQAVVEGLRDWEEIIINPNQAKIGQKLYK